MLMDLSALSSPKEEMKIGLNLETVIALSEDNNCNASHNSLLFASSRSCVIITQI